MTQIPSEVEVSPEVWDRLMQLNAPAKTVLPNTLCGLRVVLDPTLPPGTWKVAEPTPPSQEQP